MRRLLPFALVIAAARVEGQSVFDAGARTAPQFMQYHLASPSNTTISEFAVPLFVVIPYSAALSFDVGSSYAWSRVDTPEALAPSAIAGFTDTQVRAHYGIGSDFVVLTAGLNLPTGRSTVTEREQLAAGLIGSDFLGFPISNMGTGLGGTGGIAVARPVADWNLGVGASVRRSARYDPFEAGSEPALHYQPGNEYRARAGLDHPFGTGRVTIGLTYATFGNDNLGGSVYNTGDRYVAQAEVTNTVGAGDLTIVGWNLFRSSGTLADGSPLGRENVASVTAGYAVRTSGARVEPSVELRTWAQPQATPSLLANFGVAAQLTIAGFAVAPSVGYSIGRIAALDANGIGATAALTGFRGVLTIRLR